MKRQTLILTLATVAAWSAMAIDVLPADRLAMADRLFNKGEYALAVSEYRALAGEPSVAADELLYRTAECERALGRTEPALRAYGELVRKFPLSRHAASSRLQLALSARGEDRLRKLSDLDSDRVEGGIRAVALYHLGVEKGDADALQRCVRCDPKGRYADYANLQAGTLLVEDKDPARRRKGVELLLGLAFGNGPLAGGALHLSAMVCYRDRRYGEAGSLFRRYLKRFPTGDRADEAATMSVWCDFRLGRYADAEAGCGDRKSDDIAYVKAACAYATGREAEAQVAFRGYLDDYPQGRYRKDAELNLGRLEFSAASKTGDRPKLLESARRVAKATGTAVDGLRLAWAYEQCDRPQEADGEYARLTKDFRGTEEAARALFSRAMIAARTNAWSKTEIYLAEAIASGKLTDRKAAALYWRGVAAVKLGHEAEAAGFLREALACGLELDEAREARLFLAETDLRAGRTEAAKKEYAALVREGACERMSASRIHAVGRILDAAEAEICAQALVKGSSAEWRQAGWVLQGEIEEKRDACTAAIEAYRKAMAEKLRTETAAAAALSLGRLETRAGEYDRAEATLREAVGLNAGNPRARASAYLALAHNAEAKGDAKSACGYATVVLSLFDDAALGAEADAVLKRHPEQKNP